VSNKSRTRKSTQPWEAVNQTEKWIFCYLARGQKRSRTERATVEKSSGNQDQTSAHGSQRENQTRSPDLTDGGRNEFMARGTRRTHLDLAKSRGKNEQHTQNTKIHFFNEMDLYNHVNHRHPCLI
jgi:hypothetical protein